MRLSETGRDIGLLDDAQYRRFAGKRRLIEEAVAGSREARRRKKAFDLGAYPADVREAAEIELKYEGYIELQNDHVMRLKQMEGLKLPPEFDYDKVKGLSNEVRAKLKDIRPRTLAQAGEISGVTPAAISILMVYLR
jgi:tRNA U34 5-carboxymethylaminomethyl modifying enzyme MnmG/GidA